MFKSKPKMMIEAENSMISENIIKTIISFIAVFVIAFLLEGIYPSMIAWPDITAKFTESGIYEQGHKFNFREIMSLSGEVTMQPEIFIPSLFCTAFGTVTALIYCRCIEGRSFGSMGFRKKKAGIHYLTGIIAGTVLMTAITLLSAVTGANSISVCENINYGVIARYLFGFLIQGMSEEVIFRGYLMNSIGARQNIYYAIGISSAAFALAHAMNPGFGILPFINLTLFAVFASLYIICYDDIWGACAIHSVWNFTQGNLYGISVSGSGNTESIFRTTAVSSSAFLTGGDFGAEGSIFTTIVLLIASSTVIFKIRKKQSANK